MKIIVLSISAYKEKDAIISAINENESITFLARGIKDPKSKNSALNNLLTIADIELMDGDFKYPILKGSKPLDTSLKIGMDTEYLASLMLMDEMVLNLFPEEERYMIFSYLEKALANLKDTNDWLMTLLIFMAEVIRLGGFQLEVNRCVMCGGKKNIVAFSFVDGGFICQNCFSKEIIHDLNKAQMLLLREVVNSTDYHLRSNEYLLDDVKALFIKFIQFIEEAFGYRFKNLRLLNI